MPAAELPHSPLYRRVRTLVLEQKSQNQLASVDGAVWPTTGSVIELPGPKRDAVVLEVRMRLGQMSIDDAADILVLVDDPGGGGNDLGEDAERMDLDVELNTLVEQGRL